MNRFTIVLLSSCLAAGAAAQTIRITSTPAYGTWGVLTGVVTGVPFATHSVAVYIQVEGLGWWTKPTTASPTVPIAANGTFTANVVTGGLDAWATIFHVALLGPGVSPPPAAGSCAIPGLPSLATDTVERFGRTVQFAGRTWAVKQAPAPVGPGANYFSADPADVFVDSQGLHLRTVQRNGVWWATEVVLLDDTGYGTYWFQTDSQVGQLDENLTFGGFTWDSYCDDQATPSNPNREIDFEDSRWGNPNDPLNSQFVVQPWWGNGNRIRYTTPVLTPTALLTRFLQWQPGFVEFHAVRGLATPCRVPAAQVLQHSVYVHDPANGRYVPRAGRSRFRFNLWINTGSGPANGLPAEVVVRDFRYTPVRGALRGGCGVNPEGSLRVVAGSPGRGQAMTLAVDNPAGTQAAGSAAFVVFGLGADAAFPCGTRVAGLGMTGAVGEVLLDRAAPLDAVFAGTWSGPGMPVPFPFAVPASAALVGLGVWAQGLLVDGTAGAARPLGVTDALELCVY